MLLLSHKRVGLGIYTLQEENFPRNLNFAITLMANSLKQKQVIQKQFINSTLQELKLQGIKIRDGAVFSQYSRIDCLAIELSIF